MFYNLCLQDYWDILHFAISFVALSEVEGSIPVCHRPFSLWESTGSKQTLNGLFLCTLNLLSGV
jgi:hypothetical protein